MKLRLFLLLFSLTLVCDVPQPVMAQIVSPFYQRLNKGKDQYNKKQYTAALSTFKALLRDYPKQKSTVQPWINKCNARLKEIEETERRQREESARRAREDAARRQREEAEQRAEQRAREEAARRERERQEAVASLPPAIQRLVANMVYVEGGTFTMGATAEQGSDAESDEKPTHQVTLRSFHIGKYEVTQAEWQAVMGSNPSYFKGDNLPVENVSWYDCQEFIRKLNELTGKKFRLPTEAEWEYAARGGKRSYGEKYAGGGDIGSVAWYDGNSNSKTHPVGQKRGNELGLYDMSGNVYEWCQDWWGRYSSSSQTNPTGPATGSNRGFRGGSWGYDARNCRVSNRINYTPDDRSSSIGLRLAL